MIRWAAMCREKLSSSQAPAGGQLTVTFDRLDRVSAVSLEQGPAQGRLTPPNRRGALFRRPRPQD